LTHARTARATLTAALFLSAGRGQSVNLPTQGDPFSSEPVRTDCSL
jgi:hypothetical protein